MEKLVACVQKKPDALCRLICFPWAGGGTSQLARWGNLFNDSIEVSTEIKTIFIFSSFYICFYLFCFNFFFCCSIGTYVSAAVALHLKEHYGLEPVHLFMSAAHAPNMQYFLLLMSCIIQPLKFLCFGEEQKKFLNVEANSEYRYLMECFMTTFYVHRLEKAEMNIPFSCDVTYFYGSDDKIYDVQGWRELTSGDVSFYEFPGDHFYLLKPSNESSLIKHITRCIENAGL
ncbi:SAST synthase, partial [Horornis vulcanius]|nr:SAST synthase [Horornis vulcanius]